MQTQLLFVRLAGRRIALAGETQASTQQTTDFFLFRLPFAIRSNSLGFIAPYAICL